MSALHFNSPPRANRSSSKDLFSFLTDFRNFPKVLPADRISEFKVTDEGCSFNIQGIAALRVKIAKKTEFDEIVYHITGPAKTDLHLSITFTGGGEVKPGTSAVELAAHLNPFLKVMAEKPLRMIVNTIAERLADLTMPHHEN